MNVHESVNVFVKPLLLYDAVSELFEVSLYRNFNLVLRQDDTTFVQQPEMLVDRSVRHLDTSHIYQGHVDGKTMLYSLWHY